MSYFHDYFTLIVCFYHVLTAILKERRRLGRCCVELHYGCALEDEF